MKKNAARHQKAIITIVTNDCFHQAILLGNSIKAFEKETDFLIFVVGYSPEERCYQECEFEIIDAKILNPEEWERFLFQYPSVSVCCALKPKALQHALRDYEKVIYLDSDIKLFHNLETAWNGLEEADLSLTPHKNGAPQCQKPIISPLMLRLSGVFNGGYVGATCTGSAFLEWWWSKTHYNCLLDDYVIGIYLDQLYLQEAVARVDRLHLLKECGYNVAWWNLDQKEISQRHGSYFINNHLLTFFHFSCYRFFLKNPAQAQWLKNSLGEIYFHLFTTYLSEVSHYKNRLAIKSYCYDHFKDGTKISRDWREYMRRDIPELKEVVHPFDLSEKERKEIEAVMNERPEFFQPNQEREVNNWRQTDLVYTYALGKSDSYIRFLEELIHKKGLIKVVG